MYFEVHVVATEFRRKILASAAAPHFSGFFLIAAPKKDSNEKATKEEFNKMKSLMVTRDLLVAATCGQSAAGGREE
jgi:hypothetical protein